jgi:hypothetical protein
MAYPTVVSITKGNFNLADEYEFTPTLPSGNVGDLLICFVGVGRNHAVAHVQDQTGLWSESFYQHSLYHAASISIFVKYATNGSEDNLVFGTHFYYQGILGPTLSSSHIYSRPAYICYRLRDAYVELTHITGIHYKWGGDFNYVYCDGDLANWDFPRCPPSDGTSVQKDYLWIMAAASQLEDIASAAPSGFTNLETTSGSIYYQNSTSMSSCRKTDNTVLYVDPGPFTSPSGAWAGAIIRIYPTNDITPPDPPPVSEGIGFSIYRKELGIVEPVSDSIEVTPANQLFNYDGSLVDSHSTYYLEIIATDSWIAFWSDGLYFTAYQYSGGEGITYVEAHCVDTYNDSGDSYTDTLTFICGSASVDVTFEQYSL